MPVDAFTSNFWSPKLNSKFPLHGYSSNALSLKLLPPAPKIYAPSSLIELALNVISTSVFDVGTTPVSIYRPTLFSIYFALSRLSEI